MPQQTMKKGSRRMVWNGSAVKTGGGLTKDDLMKNKYGRIVSIKILCEQKFEDLKLENNITNNLKKDIVWDFLFEHIFLAILTKDFLFMRKIIHILKNKKNPHQFNHIKHQININTCQLQTSIEQS